MQGNFCGEGIKFFLDSAAMQIPSMAQSHEKSLSTNFSSIYLAVKDVEEANVCSSP